MSKQVFWKGFTILGLWIGLGILLLGLVDPIAEPIVAPLIGISICILTLYLYRSARSGKLQRIKYLRFLYDERTDQNIIYFASSFGCVVGLAITAIRVSLNNLAQASALDDYAFQAHRQQILIANNIQLIVVWGMALIMITTTGYLFFCKHEKRS